MFLKLSIRTLGAVLRFVFFLRLLENSVGFGIWVVFIFSETECPSAHCFGVNAVSVLGLWPFVCRGFGTKLELVRFLE